MKNTTVGGRIDFISLIRWWWWKEMDFRTCFYIKNPFCRLLYCCSAADVAAPPLSFFASLRGCPIHFTLLLLSTTTVYWSRLWNTEYTTLRYGITLWTGMTGWLAGFSLKCVLHKIDRSSELSVQSQQKFILPGNSPFIVGSLISNASFVSL